MKTLAEQIHDAEGAVSLLREKVDAVIFDDALTLRIDDWFADSYDNSIELVLEPGKTPADVSHGFDEYARGWGFSLIHFNGFPSSQSRFIGKKAP